MSKGTYSKNYNEALGSIAKAMAGNPIMPGESKTTLASLISMAGLGKNTGDLTSMLSKSSAGASVALKAAASGVSGQQTINTYYVNGIKIGEQAANNTPLSSLMKNLAVYSNSSI